MLAVYAGLLILIAAAIGGASLAWLTSRSDDRLAVISNFLSFGTLLLALVAGIVALAAYAAATGLPDLKLRFIPQQGTFNRARFTQDESGGVPEDTAVILAVRNYSTYAARSPAVVVEFENGIIPVRKYTGSNEWTPVNDPRSKYILALQWDGGPNYSIHGNSIRYLPELHLGGLCGIRGGSAKIVIRLLADGYSRREITLPVEFTINPQAHEKALVIPPGWI